MCVLIWTKGPCSSLLSSLQSCNHVLIAVVFATFFIRLLGAFIRNIVLLHSWFFRNGWLQPELVSCVFDFLEKVAYIVWKVPLSAGIEIVAWSGWKSGEGWGRSNFGEGSSWGGGRSSFGGDGKCNEGISALIGGIGKSNFGGIGIAALNCISGTTTIWSFSFFF